MFDVFKIGFYVLLLLPGFIWVQVNDHYLARKKREQLEHTLSIVLISSFIWLLAFLSFTPRWPRALRILVYVAHKGEGLASTSTSEALCDFGYVFLTVSVCSFIAANLWSIVRKLKIIERHFNWFTGRTWHPSVSFQFFQENIDGVITLKAGESLYLGTLYAAPDSVEDRHIILKDISVYQSSAGSEPTLTRVPTANLSQVLIRLDDIAEVHAYNKLSRPRQRAAGAQGVKVHD